MTNQQGAPEALYASAMEFAAEKASISYVQRKCRCSWNDAEQMLERMVREGIIATYNGRKSAALVEAQQRATHVQNPSEIEHVAGDVSKNGPESNMAQQPALSVEWQCGQQASGFSQQPAPSAAAAVAIKAMGYGGSTGINDYLMSDGTVQAMRPSEVKWAPQPSPTPPPAKVELFNPLEGGNPETALQMAAVIALRDSQPARDYPPLPEPQYQMGGKGHSDAAMRAYVDADRAARTQADSQPAMTPETVYAAIAHGDEEHRAWLLSALRAVWCGEAVPPVASPIANAAADSQPAPAEVVDV